MGTQDFDDGEHVIAYTSRTLKGRQCHYSATELECLAVLHGLEAFRPYIDAYHFELITDHSSRKGTTMQAPDALSRNPIEDTPEVGLVDIPEEIVDEWYRFVGFNWCPRNLVRLCCMSAMIPPPAATEGGSGPSRDSSRRATGLAL